MFHSQSDRNSELVLRQVVREWAFYQGGSKKEFLIESREFEFILNESDLAGAAEKVLDALMSKADDAQEKIEDLNKSSDGKEKNKNIDEGVLNEGGIILGASIAMALPTIIKAVGWCLSKVLGLMGACRMKDDLDKWVDGVAHKLEGMISGFFKGIVKVMIGAAILSYTVPRDLIGDLLDLEQSKLSQKMLDWFKSPEGDKVMEDLGQLLELIVVFGMACYTFGAIYAVAKGSAVGSIGLFTKLSKLAGEAGLAKTKVEHLVHLGPEVISDIGNRLSQIGNEAVALAALAVFPAKLLADSITKHAKNAWSAIVEKIMSVFKKWFKDTEQKTEEDKKCITKGAGGFFDRMWSKAKDTASGASKKIKRALGQDFDYSDEELAAMPMKEYYVITSGGQVVEHSMKMLDPNYNMKKLRLVESSRLKNKSNCGCNENRKPKNKKCKC